MGDAMGLVITGLALILAISWLLHRDDREN